HPNHSLVQSVCRSLHQGFWPWAMTTNHNYLTTYDNAEGYHTLTNPTHLAFTHQQCTMEVAAGHFSQSFGPDLLPGMYAVPMWVIPKPHSNGLHLVIDHNAGEYSLNSMISRAECTQLSETLIATQACFFDHPLVVWKSDISHTYQILPMHLLWQMKQTIVLDAQQHVDTNNDFGSGGSGHIWSVFFTLVLWIA
ncbi:hypothetical protein FISHEDRAFT_20647, partial [Fistulina hepatica ATCC 64428]